MFETIILIIGLAAMFCGRAAIEHHYRGKK